MNQLGFPHSCPTRIDWDAGCSPDMRRWSNNRGGLSIMEVIFAVGVLLIGLLGIASILPVAANNANNALRSDATTAAIENQISNAVGRLPERLTYVDVPNSSLIAVLARSRNLLRSFACADRISSSARRGCLVSSS
jgi:hypothetical protein